MGYGNGTDRSRTDDLLRVKQALFQLSYDPALAISTVYINRFFAILRKLAKFWPRDFLADFFNR